MEIQPATPEMFDGIHDVLREFGGSLTKADWKQLLDYRFSHESHRGWVSLKHGEIVGYLGAIFSEREGARLCGLTSWIVKQKHRKGSLHLLQPMLELSEHTLLNFSPSPFTLMMFQRLGFVPLDEHIVLIPPLTPAVPRRGFHIVRSPAEVEQLLSPAHRRIFVDHQRYQVRHIVVATGREYCYLVVSRTRFRRWPISFLHHVSNPALLRAAVNVVQRELFRVNKTLLTAVDARLVEGHPIRGGYRHRLAQPRLYRPAANQDIARGDIDSLYTEFVVLNPTRWTFNF